MARSISVASRMLTGLTSTPTEGATDWITANWPIPAEMVASRSTAARVMPGAISLSNSSHFALRLYSNCMKPVTLPPGRAKLSTKPAPTGSGTTANTIGMTRFPCRAVTPVTPDASMTSGASATSSAANLRAVSMSPASTGNRCARCGRQSSLVAEGHPAKPQHAPLIGVLRRLIYQHPDAADSLRLLRLRREWPRSRSAHKRKKLAPLDSDLSRMFQVQRKALLRKCPKVECPVWITSDLSAARSMSAFL